MLHSDIVSASIKVIELLDQTTELRDRLEENTKFFRGGMQSSGFDIRPGEHPIVIKDVMGNVETASVTVEPPPLVDALLPLWLDEWVANLDAGEVEFPPQSITRYVHQGEEVYYVVMQCCDQFSDLLDAEGNLIGHPDGGITGRGDGVTKFSPSELEGEEIWRGGDIR